MEEEWGEAGENFLYSRGMSYEEIKRRKRTLKENVKTFSFPQKKTQIQEAIQRGCYFTVEVLLPSYLSDISDFALREQEKHQLAREALFHNKILIQTLIQSYGDVPRIVMDALKIGRGEHSHLLFNRPNASLEQLQILFQGMPDYKVAKNHIDGRIDSLLNRQRFTFLKGAALSSVCPAFTIAGGLAALFSPIGGLWLVPILTIALFPIIFLPFFYVNYKKNVQEYDALNKEKLYRLWATSQLRNRYEALRGRREEYEKFLVGFDSAENKEEFLMGRSLLPREEEGSRALFYENITTDFSSGKLKLRCHELPQSTLSAIKAKAAFDHENSVDWALREDSLFAWMGYFNDILCPLGAAMSVTFVTFACIHSTIGFAFLGVGLAAFLATPVGAIAAGAIVATALTIIIGVLMYNVAHQQTKAQQGERNKDFFLSHAECKRTFKAVREEEARGENLSGEIQALVPSPGTFAP